MISQPKTYPLLILLILFSFTALERNSLWHSELTMWVDTSTKSSKKARPYNGIGMVYSNQGSIDLAIKAFSTAIDLEPDFYISHNNLGSEMFRVGRYDEARILFERAIGYDYNYPDAHNNLGSAYALVGDIDKAITQFKIAYDQNPFFVDAMLNLARAYILKGNKAGANTMLDRVLTLSPEEKDVQILRKML